MSDLVTIRCAITARDEAGDILGRAGVALSDRERRAGEGVEECRP